LERDGESFRHGSFGDEELGERRGSSVKRNKEMQPVTNYLSSEPKAEAFGRLFGQIARSIYAATYLKFVPVDGTLTHVLANVIDQKLKWQREL